MNQTTREADAFKEFKAIFSGGQALFALRQIGEKRKGVVAFLKQLRPFPVPVRRLRKRGPFPELLPPDELKHKLTQWSDDVDVALCDSPVVLAVSALEVYLREAYLGATGEQWKGRPLQSIETLNNWEKSLKAKCNLDVRPFKAVSEGKMKEVFQWRHVIVHSGGTVDEKAKIPGVTKGQSTKDLLTLKKTKELLDCVKECASAIHTQFTSQGQRL